MAELDTLEDITEALRNVIAATPRNDDYLNALLELYHLVATAADDG